MTHRGYVLRMKAGSPDTKGRGARQQQDRIMLRGRVSLVNARELAAAHQLGESLDAVWWVDVGAPVDAKDQVEIPSQPYLPAQLAGVFEVAAVRPNERYLRVMLRRSTPPR